MNTLRILLWSAICCLTALFVVFVLLSRVEGQETPSAPEPQVRTLCHYEWSVPRDSISGAATGHEVCHAAAVSGPKSDWHYLGEAPFASKAPGFFTVGRWDAPRPLRTARQTLTSKSFLLLELGMYGAALADVNVNRNHRQNPPTPAHGELYIDAFAPLPVITFLHYLSDRYICRAIGVGAVGYVIGRHLYAVGRNVYP